MKLRHRIVLIFLPMLLVPFVAVTILQVDRTMQVMGERDKLLGRVQTKYASKREVKPRK